MLQKRTVAGIGARFRIANARRLADWWTFPSESVQLNTVEKFTRFAHIALMRVVRLKVYPRLWKMSHEITSVISTTS